MGEWVTGAIESVRQSSYKDIEIIVINDGSDDEHSLRVLATLENEPGVRIIHKKNEGLAVARNEGARQAKGEFLAFLDADDKVGPHYYQQAVQVLKKCLNVYFVGCWVQYFGNSEKLWPSFTPQPPYLFVHNPVNSSSLVYKTKSFLKSGLNDRNLEYGLEDYESVVSMMASGYNGVVLPDVHFFYRVRDNSMFRNLNKNKLIYAYKYITEKHKNYFSKHATGVINLLNANGPGYFFDNPTEEVNVVSRVKQKSRLYELAGSYIRKRPALKRLALKMLSIIK
jgi:glycosyltransferase involved in cell wall biosynthesis